MRSCAGENLFLAFVLSLTALVTACDSGSPRRRVGNQCSSASECESGICGASICLEPTGDNDLDGLTNATETALGSSPVLADTDGDGLGDRAELGPDLAPIDTDRDGRPDILESAIADVDGDCITDQFDARDDQADTDVSPMIPVVCRLQGICAGSGAGLGAACAEDGTARCLYDGVIGWEDVERTCDGRDENCDGTADEGLCPATMEALELPASIALPVGGSIAVEARARLADGEDAGLDGTEVVWEVVQDEGTPPVALASGSAGQARITLQGLVPGGAEVRATLGAFSASAQVAVTAPACDDGVENGDETGIDCGGLCGWCPDHPCAQGACGENGTCQANGEGFICDCDDGFEQGTGGGCVDINECAQSATDCGANAQCVNRAGGFDCDCDVGFEPVSGGGCGDIDECALAATSCGANGECVNRDGGFDCSCDDGFEPVPGGGCGDIDECELATTQCGANAQCANREGGFDCVCSAGFVFGPSGTCGDINECVGAPSPCGVGAVCENRSGGYDCVCAEGFEPDGDGGCAALACWTGTAGGIDPGCSSTAPVCDVAAGRVCIECLADGDCTGRAGGPICETSLKTCVRCIDAVSGTDPGCAAPTPVCDLAGGRSCVRCLADSDCAGASEGPLCDEDGPRCVACFDTTDCPWRQYGDTCNATLGSCTPGSRFVTVWDTRIVLGLDADGVPLSPGESPARELTLPLVATGTYDFLVEWGDGTFDVIAAWDDPKTHHRYPSAGLYEVSVRGVVAGWRFAAAGDRAKLVDVRAWGPLRLGTGGRHFEGAANMVVTATDLLNLQGTTNLMATFKGCASITDLPGIGAWDTSAVTNLYETFMNATLFEGDVSTWDVSAVTNLGGTFDGAQAFNADVSGWDVAQVTTLERTFSRAPIFNRDISSWDTSRVTSLSATFAGASRFNQPIGIWNTGEVRNMGRTFEGAASFNRPVAAWNTSKVTNMTGTFRSASTFNQPVGAWDTRAVTSMYGTFQSALVFNQPLDSWNVSNVTEMSFLFAQARAFNRDLASWDVSRVTNMGGIFSGASAFNGDITTWDVSSVTRMSSMFGVAAAFNRDISGWRPLAATDMNGMFSGASSFNQPIGSWTVANVIDMSDMFLLAASFDQPIGGWNVSKVRSMSRMFRNAVRFNQDLRTWDTRSVTTMFQMFSNASAFAGNISGWNTSAVVDMGEMFNDARLFNSAIGGWNVANVTRMNGMFANATSFSQNLGAWNVGKVQDFTDFLNGAALSTVNYDGLLNGWSGLSVLVGNLTLDAGGSRYSTAGANARSALASGRGWTILDGGPSGQ